MIVRGIFIKIGLLSFFIAACDGSSEGTAEKEAESVEPETAIPLQKPETMAERRQVRQQIADSRARDFDRAPADDGDTVRGEVPSDILDKITSDLASKIGADPAAIDVLRAESLVWNDGSLGCSKPDQAYTQALVPGYRVILGHAGQVFDYRATERGLFVLCEQPTLAAPGTGNEPPVQ